MFRMLRYGLMPVVFFCAVVVVSGVHIVWTNTVHRSTWPQTVLTVLKSQDIGNVLAQFQHRENSFPDPRGMGTYVVGGKTYAWQGRGRDIGVTVMKPGDQITLYSNGQQYLYTVQERLLVTEEGVSADQHIANAQLIAPTDHEVVTLVTCWPAKGPDKFTQRVVVRAIPFGATSAGQTSGQSNWTIR